MDHSRLKRASLGIWGKAGPREQGLEVPVVSCWEQEQMLVSWLRTAQWIAMNAFTMLRDLIKRVELVGGQKCLQQHGNWETSPAVILV